MQNKSVFLYPGQGSQYVGMGLDFYTTCPHARRMFDEADRFLGFSLSRLCFEGPEELLHEDLNSQLAVYTVSCIITHILRAENIAPAAVSGYSAGFYAAAYAAGCFDFIRGLSIVRRAGELLLEAGRAHAGGLAVIFGLSVDEVEEVCRMAGQVGVAIRNTYRQTVISGLKESVEKAMKLSREKGALDAYPLPVAAAYHSRFVQQSSLRFQQEIQEDGLRTPDIPLLSYLTLQPVSGPRELLTVMADQLSRPVLWVDVITQLRQSNKGRWFEVGPGAVIARTVRWIDRGIEVSNTATVEQCRSAVQHYAAPRETQQPAFLQEVLES